LPEVNHSYSFSGADRNNFSQLGINNNSTLNVPRESTNF
jgi:hypothetical protein